MAAAEETIQEKFNRVIAEAQRLTVLMKKIDPTLYQHLESYLNTINAMKGRGGIFNGDNNQQLIANMEKTCEQCNEMLGKRNKPTPSP